MFLFQEIDHGKKYEIRSSNGTHKLHINDVVGEDEGKYSITFKDTDVTSTAKLTVKGTGSSNIALIGVNMINMESSKWII